MRISHPTLLVDEIKSREHINHMQQKAKQSNIDFRPHFKTHQSRAIGRWYKDAGITKITTSSLAMAEYFANDGWNDITVAFPLNFLEVEMINSLSGKVQLNVCVVSLESIEKLLHRLEGSIRVFVEVDTGYGRTGVDPLDYPTINSIMELINLDKRLSFAGFLSHAGHSYKCRSKKEIEEVYQTSTRIAVDLSLRYRNTYPDMIVSIGDTPCCSTVEVFKDVNEIRPGNFVFYDVTQSEIGSCSVNDVAIVLACPIVAIHEKKNEIVVHGGAVHLSKDTIMGKNGKNIFGRIAELREGGWEVLSEEFYVKSISQEHGIISVPQGSIGGYKIGDVIGIIPVHSCLTADCMAGYLTLSGEKLDHFKCSK